MALTEGSPKVVITMVDQGGKEVNYTFPTTLDPATVDIATLKTERDDLVAKLTAVSDGTIKSATVHIPQTDPDVVPGTKYKNEYLNVQVRVDSTQVKEHNMRVPMAKDSLYIGATGPDSLRLDVTGAEIIAFKELFETGGTFSVSDGEQLDPNFGPIYGDKRFQRSKGRTP